MLEENSLFTQIAYYGQDIEAVMGTTYDKDRVRKNVAGKSRKSVFYLYRFS
jgi:hypothetical protein